MPGAAEESDLVRLGDYVLGVTGVCVTGFDVPTLLRTIAVARSNTPGGLVVLHLCDVPIAMDLVEEAAIQVANAAAQLLQSRVTVENVQTAVYAAVSNGGGVASTAGGTTFPGTGSHAADLSAIAADIIMH